MRSGARSLLHEGSLSTAVFASKESSSASPMKCLKLAARGELNAVFERNRKGGIVMRLNRKGENAEGQEHHRTNGKGPYDVGEFSDQQWEKKIDGRGTPVGRHILKGGTCRGGGSKVAA